MYLPSLQDAQPIAIMTSFGLRCTRIRSVIWLCPDPNGIEAYSTPPDPFHGFEKWRDKEKGGMRPGEK